MLLFSTACKEPSFKNKSACEGGQIYDYFLIFLMAPFPQKRLVQNIQTKPLRDCAIYPGVKD